MRSPVALRYSIDERGEVATAFCASNRSCIAQRVRVKITE
jgi:hypothetical protein